MTKKKGHFRALDYRKCRSVQDYRNPVQDTICETVSSVSYTTATRSGESRRATWSEIDWDTATWEIPASKMKAGKPHRVPLTRSALAILEQAKSILDGSDLIFPSPANPDSPLSDMVWAKPFAKSGLAEKTTVHGFRTSFRTWASECTDVPREVCEMALAHTVGNAWNRLIPEVIFL